MGSKSFSGNKNLSIHSSDRGLEAEKTVQNYFLNKTWKILTSRSIINDTEIDLIVTKDDRLVILEVKQLDNPWRSFERVHHNQIKRLKIVLFKLRQKYKAFKVSGYIVFVSYDQKLKFISLDEIL